MAEVQLHLLAPRFRIVPPAEHMACNILKANLFNLASAVARFAAAIALYDFCDPRNSEGSAAHKNYWRNMAGRDGALTLFDFAQLIEATRSSLNEVPTLLPFIDTGALKIAEKLFASQFQYFHLVRHAAAHPGELFSTTQSLEENVITGEYMTPIGKMVNDGGAIVLGGGFFDRTYQIMIDRRLVGYDLTLESHDKLVKITMRIYEAFARAQG